ncbi:MAG: (d)CMP kinase [Acidimicrobiia bacterium]|nr:(d)CMP kinase [Acidimicrobiia bacterium]MBP8179828.1 (d)CMP kinase [Acidimicrobiia bacterium]
MLSGLPVIAIDGPSGTGKSTLASSVARRLKMTQIDTGALYRAASWLVLERGVDPSDSDAVAACVAAAEFSYGPELLIDGKAPGDLRSPEINKVVSHVAAVPAVRTHLVAVMRRRAEQLGGTVMEGRDIGSVVFPDAVVKVYLEADPDVRARRRLAEEHDAGRHHLDHGAVLETLVERDRLDSTREIAPLTVAPGAIRLDSSMASVEELTDLVVDLYREALAQA